MYNIKSPKTTLDQLEYDFEYILNICTFTDTKYFNNQDDYSQLVRMYTFLSGIKYQGEEEEQRDNFGRDVTDLINYGSISSRVINVLRSGVIEDDGPAFFWKYMPIAWILTTDFSFEGGLESILLKSPPVETTTEPESKNNRLLLKFNEIITSAARENVSEEVDELLKNVYIHCIQLISGLLGIILNIVALRSSHSLYSLLLRTLTFNTPINTMTFKGLENIYGQVIDIVLSKTEGRDIFLGVQLIDYEHDLYYALYNGSDGSDFRMYYPYHIHYGLFPLLKRKDGRIAPKKFKRMILNKERCNYLELGNYHLFNILNKNLLFDIIRATDNDTVCILGDKLSQRDEDYEYSYSFNILATEDIIYNNRELTTTTNTTTTTTTTTNTIRKEYDNIVYTDESTIPNAGLGVFAKVPIKKGQVLGQYTGEYLSQAELDERYPGDTLAVYTIKIKCTPLNQCKVCTYLPLFGQELEFDIEDYFKETPDPVPNSEPHYFYIDARDTSISGWPRFINEGTRSNKINNVEFQTDGAVIAIIPIDAHDELFVDYGNTYWSSNNNNDNLIQTPPVIQQRPKPKLTNYLNYTTTIYNRTLKDTERDKIAQTLSESKKWCDVGNPAKDMIPDASISINAHDLCRLGQLKESGWFNDSIIDYYILLLKEYSMSRGLNNSYVDTYFYSRLSMGANGKSIKLPKFITPKVCQGWINSRKLIIPINLGQTVVRKNKNGQPQSTGSHWVLGVINFEAKKIQYYDSYRNTNATFFKYMLLMLPDIYTMAASLGTFIETEWTQESNIGINDDSLQIDGFNCGVFTCLFAAYVTVDIRFNFSGSLDNMSLMRKFIMLDMLNREFTGFT